MNKEKLLAALYAFQNTDAGGGTYHDELETLIGIMVSLDDSLIEAVWKEMREDAEDEAETAAKPE